MDGEDERSPWRRAGMDRIEEGTVERGTPNKNIKL